MFKYFLEDQPKDINPVKKYTKMDFLSRRYNSEIIKIKEYYNNRIRAVDNDNMLSRLIDTLHSNHSLPIDEYFKIVATNAVGISKQFGIISNSHKGEILDNVLYSKNSKEVFLYTEKDLDIFTYEDTWKLSTPLRVIKTDDYILDLNVIYDAPKRELELTIVEIDVIDLMLKYRSWCIERMSMDHSINSNVFIATMVYPSMLNQIVDLVIFNRFLKLYENDGVLSNDVKNPHPFSVINYVRGLDDILNSVLKDVTNVTIPLDQLLSSVPTISGNDMKTVLSLTNKYYTVQTEWVLWLSRMEYVYKLLRIMDYKGIRKNGDIVQKIPVYIKYIERVVRRLDSDLSNEVIAEFVYYKEQIKKIVGRR